MHVQHACLQYVCAYVHTVFHYAVQLVPVAVGTRLVSSPQCPSTLLGPPKINGTNIGVVYGEFRRA